MTELADRTVDSGRAAAQWANLYEILTSLGTVYLIPPVEGLQDQVFTANAAATIGDTVIVSNHSTEPRRGESLVTSHFFRWFSNLTTSECPYRFEGEADLKHLHDNVYIGGYGQRSDRRAYQWMTEHLDVQIVMVQERDEHLYHLDCSVYPLTTEATLICVDMFTRTELRHIEAVTNVVAVTEDEAYTGITNCLRAEHLVLNGSHIHDLHHGTDEYNDELHKNRRLEDIALAHDLEPVLVNVSEYHKAGALLSCLAMRLA